MIPLRGARVHSGGVVVVRSSFADVCIMCVYRHPL